MSYRWWPTFKCELCGKKGPAKFWDEALISPIVSLPKGWTGSKEKRGSCYCEECSHGIEMYKAHMESEDATKGVC